MVFTNYIKPLEETVCCRERMILDGALTTTYPRHNVLLTGLSQSLLASFRLNR